jgi:hypothetical protein
MLVIGDSHTKIWSSFDFPFKEPMSKFKGVKIYPLEAPLAYNFLSETGEELGKWGGGEVR